MQITEMVYTDEGEIIPVTEQVVTIDPSLEEAALCMWSFCPTQSYRRFRLPIAGEIGTVGRRRIIISKSNPSAIKDIDAFRVEMGLPPVPKGAERKGFFRRLITH